MSVRRHAETYIRLKIQNFFNLEHLTAKIYVIVIQRNHNFSGYLFEKINYLQVKISESSIWDQNRN